MVYLATTTTITTTLNTISINTKLQNKKRNFKNEENLKGWQFTGPPTVLPMLDIFKVNNSSNKKPSAILLVNQTQITESLKNLHKQKLLKKSSLYFLHNNFN